MLGIYWTIPASKFKSRVLSADEDRMESLLSPPSDVKKVLVERLAGNVRYRTVVFKTSDTDRLGLLETTVTEEAKDFGVVRVVAHSYLRDRLSHELNGLENWIRATSVPRDEVRVLINPTGAMINWTKSWVRQAWSVLSRVEFGRIIVLDAVGPVHEDGFCCNNPLGNGLRYSYAESDDERSWRWTELLLQVG